MPGIPEFYPESYGAAANGVTDDYTALQAAITAACAAQGTVVLAPKPYRCVGSLNLRWGKVRIKGSGWDHIGCNNYYICHRYGTLLPANYGSLDHVGGGSPGFGGSVIFFEGCDGFITSNQAIVNGIYLSDFLGVSNKVSTALPSGATVGDLTVSVRDASVFADPGGSPYYIRVGINPITGEGGETILLQSRNVGANTITFSTPLRFSYAAERIVRNRARPYFGIDFGDYTRRNDSGSINACGYVDTTRLGMWGWDVAADYSLTYPHRHYNDSHRGSFEGVRLGNKPIYDAASAQVNPGDGHVHVTDIERWPDPAVVGSYVVLVGYNYSGGELQTVTSIDYAGSRLLFSGTTTGTYPAGYVVWKQEERGMESSNGQFTAMDLQSLDKCVALYGCGPGTNFQGGLFQGFTGSAFHVQTAGINVSGVGIEGIYCEPGGHDVDAYARGPSLLRLAAENGVVSGLNCGMEMVSIRRSNFNNTDTGHVHRIFDFPTGYAAYVGGLHIEDVSDYSGAVVSFPSYVNFLSVDGGRYDPITVSTPTAFVKWAQNSNGTTTPGTGAAPTTNMWRGCSVQAFALPSESTVAAKNICGSVTFFYNETSRLINVGADPNWHDEPDGNYDIILTLQEVTDGPCADGARIADVSGKTTTGFRINLQAQPGGIASVRYAWLLIRRA